MNSQAKKRRQIAKTERLQSVHFVRFVTHFHKLALVSVGFSVNVVQEMIQ